MNVLLKDEIHISSGRAIQGREVPPDVTTGGVLVVGGGTVVVGGGTVVGVGAVGAGAPAVGALDGVVDAWAGGGVVGAGAGAGAGFAVVVVVAPVGSGVDDGALALALEPGCSRATVTPMNAATPVETRTMARVRRRRRTSALARVNGEYRSRVRLMATEHGCDGAARVSEGPWVPAERTRPT
jgi:hypothetical protein